MAGVLNPSGIEIRRINWIALIALVIWTALIVTSVTWSYFAVQHQTHNLAINEARANINKDIATRFWVASHGGVYVPVDDRTPPNPVLSHIPERDIETPSGTQLTLMNPAYVIRQLTEEYAKKYGIKGKVTTFPDKLMNPINAPDEWELASLGALHQGRDEVFEYIDVDGQPSLRLMHPLFINQDCLKCHAFQGYKIGDLRGGVGVIVPMSSYFAAQQEHVNILFFSHAVFWFFGAGAILFILQRSKSVALELMESIEDAKRANLTKDRFLANMSHEFRTPLNAVIGFSEMMKSETFGPLGHDKYREYVNDIFSGGRHLLHVITDILDISKIESGTLEILKNEVDVEPILAMCIRLSQNSADAALVTIKLDMAEGLPYLLADEQRIQQIVINLLSNAIKFTPENGCIIVRAGTTDMGGILLQVIDTGIGISPEDIPRVVNPFEQVGNIMTRPHEGSGLGLAICRLLAEKQGGSMKVDSEVGKGTTITICFPPESSIYPS